jgi:hypothetical protein
MGKKYTVDDVVVLLREASAGLWVLVEVEIEKERVAERLLDAIHGVGERES